MNKTLEYAFYGAIFGSAFPVVSTFFDLWVQSLPFTLSNALLIQRAQPLHWVIDSAPLFLGLFAAMIGKRQEAVAAKVRELTEVNKHLQSEYRDRVAAEQRAQEALEAEQNAHRLLQDEQTTLKTLTTGLQQLFDDGFVVCSVLVVRGLCEYLIVRFYGFFQALLLRERIP